MKLIKMALVWFLLSNFGLNIARALNANLHESNYMKIRENPERFEQFFKELPKGGELHSHIQGAVSPEALLAIAKNNSYWIDPASFTVIVSPSEIQKKNLMTLDLAMNHPDLRQKIIEAWSNLNYKGESPHTHFFDAFGKFKAITSLNKDKLLFEVLKNSWENKISYIELMMNPITNKLKHLAKNAQTICKVPASQSLKFLTCLEQNKIMEEIPKISELLTRNSAYAARQLNYDIWDADDSKGTTLRVVYQIARVAKPEIFLTHLYTAFLLAHQDQRVVGINLVQPEFNQIAIQEYDRQMEYIALLKKRFPEVGVTLHAGEVTERLSDNLSVRTHIRRAVSVGYANRVGHGVAVNLDPDPKSLFELLKSRQILVEINLSSNQFILGVKGLDHPFLSYLHHGVPVALSTDDGGILQTNMSAEFKKAAREYSLTYGQIKTIAFNSIKYSFLESGLDESMSAQTCAEGNSNLKLSGQKCQDRIDNSSKALLLRRLTDQYRHFETKWFGSQYRSRVFEPRHQS